MKLSTKCRYGTRAMIEIGRVYGAGSIKRKDISRIQEISSSYLENILITLKTHRLITTTRGAQGGFSLARSPVEISLLDIISALEGSIAPVECLEKSSLCHKSTGCAARKAWKKLHEAQKNVLSSITLQNLIDTDGMPGTENYSI
jgi:Rrf2 family cysteine metabolism transcriptional repressor